MKPARTPGTDGPSWYTASLGGEPGVTPEELSALQEHLGRCLATRGPWFHARRRADAVLGFVAARLVTTLLALGLVLALAWMF